MHSVWFPFPSVPLTCHHVTSELKELDWEAQRTSTHVANSVHPLNMCLLSTYSECQNQASIVHSSDLKNVSLSLFPYSCLGDLYLRLCFWRNINYVHAMADDEIEWTTKVIMDFLFTGICEDRVECCLCSRLGGLSRKRGAVDRRGQYWVYY